MHCPKCSHIDTKVIDTRPGKENYSIRRRRECLSCEHRFTTLEELVREELVVIKRDGRREDFSRSKILQGVKQALQKRSIPMETVESMVERTVVKIYNNYDTEIPSEHIGQLVMEALEQLDPIGYLRFASVYKSMEDLSELSLEIRKLKNSRKTK